MLRKADLRWTHQVAMTVTRPISASVSNRRLCHDGAACLTVAIVLMLSSQLTTLAAISFYDSGQSLGGGVGTSGVALGDVDGDGDLDAVFVCGDTTSTRVFLNQAGLQGGARGVLADSGQSLGTGMSVSVAMGDLDGDGDLDLFVLRAVAVGANEVWINQGGDQEGSPGVFAKSAQTFGDDWGAGVALGEMDANAGLDAFVTRRFSGADKVWVNDGAGQFSDSGQSLGSDAGCDVALADVDADGDLDAFVATDGANKVWINQGGAQAGTKGVYSDSGQALGNSLTHGIALGDLDKDGDADALCAEAGADRVWLNQGGIQSGTAGVFLDSGQLIGSGESRDVALDDLDGDGDLDAFIARVGANKIYENVGSAVFADSGVLLGSSVTTAIALGDVDGDGDTDALVGNWDSADQVWLNAHAAPRLMIKDTSSNMVEVAWLPDDQGWILQGNTTLWSTNWMDLNGASTNPVSIPMVEDRMFYRLRKP